MPKRKRSKSKDLEDIRKKLKRLEKELRGKRRRIIESSSCSSSSRDSSPTPEKIADGLITESDPPEINFEMNPSSINVASQDLPEETELDPELLDILGLDPSSTRKFGKSIQKDLAVRLEHVATHGLTKELRKELLDKYLLPENSKLIDSPVLNPEIKAAITDLNYKRDKALEYKQKQTTAAISCLAEATTLVLNSEEKNPVLVKLLTDVCRILCDSQHHDSITRRNFILAVLKKEMREQLQTSKIDEFLFSKDLPETLKKAKAINKSVADLKATAPMTNTRPSFKQTVPVQSKNLNWKAPPKRRPPGTQRSREPASQKKPPASSSRTSQRTSRQVSRRPL